MKPLLFPALLCLTMVFAAFPAQAESRFGTAMKKHYRLRSVSCYTCHIKGEEKEVLNSFGKTVDKLVEGKQLSEEVAIAKDAESEARQKIYEEVEKEFIAALKKLDKMKLPNGKTYAEAITSGEIEGIKLRD